MGILSVSNDISFVGLVVLLLPGLGSPTLTEQYTRFIDT